MIIFEGQNFFIHKILYIQQINMTKLNIYEIWWILLLKIYFEESLKKQKAFQCYASSVKGDIKDNQHICYSNYQNTNSLTIAIQGQGEGNARSKAARFYRIRSEIMNIVKNHKDVYYNCFHCAKYK